MKKQIKKLSLNKKTISNLNASEMNRLNGGQTGASICYYCGGATKNCSQNQATCPGHKTCYNCRKF